MSLKFLQNLNILKKSPTLSIFLYPTIEKYLELIFLSYNIYGYFLLLKMHFKACIISSTVGFNLGNFLLWNDSHRFSLHTIHENIRLALTCFVVIMDIGLLD